MMVYFRIDFHTDSYRNAATSDAERLQIKHLTELDRRRGAGVNGSAVASSRLLRGKASSHIAAALCSQFTHLNNLMIRLNGY